MSSENFLLTILSSSLTGAGLVLAIYALILPYTRDILAKRADNLVDTLSDIQIMTEGLSTATTPESLEQLENKITEIKDTIDMPSFIKGTILGSFIAFAVSAVSSLLWFIPTIEPNVKDLIIEGVPIVFGLAMVGFFISGYSTLKEIISILEVEYKRQKKKSYNKTRKLS